MQIFELRKANNAGKVPLTQTCYPATYWSESSVVGGEGVRGCAFAYVCVMLNVFLSI